MCEEFPVSFSRFLTAISALSLLFPYRLSHSACVEEANIIGIFFSIKRISSQINNVNPEFTASKSLSSSGLFSPAK